MGRPNKFPGAEKLKVAKKRTLPWLEEHSRPPPVDARRGNVRTDAIHRQQRQREQHAVAQIRDAEEIPECFDESIHNLIALGPFGVRCLPADLLLWSVAGKTAARCRTPKKSMPLPRMCRPLW